MPHALIIDDNRMNIEVLTLMLSHEGLTYTALESARQLDTALGTLDTVDVVFLDLEMPNHDGFKLIRDLKSDLRLHGAPIVAYTVHTSEVDKARHTGFDAFLGKPLNTQQFPDQLKRILAGEAVWEI